MAYDKEIKREIKPVDEEKAEKLYDELALCAYCKEPFRECDTVIPGKGVIIGEMDVVEYKDRFWHYGCVFDSKKKKHEKRMG